MAKTLTNFNLPKEIEKTLNKKQRLFFDAVSSGKNVLLTGAAGVGKTYVTKALVDLLISNEYPCGVTASTGVAALQLEGSTFHSWCLGGLGDDSVETIVRNIRFRKKKLETIKAAKALVIDEAWMLGSETFDKASEVLKKIRNSYKPFGGLQVTLLGDPLQIPPVNKGEAKQNFLFESDAFKELNLKPVVLDEIVRQADDKEFAELLMEIRVGNLKNINKLNKRTFTSIPKMQRTPPIIYCLNKDVDEENKNRLNALSGESRFFDATDIGDPKFVESLDRICNFPKRLELKVGAQVMLLRNLDTEGGYVNGSIGIVKGFSPDGIIVRFQNGEIVVEKESSSIKESVIINGVPELEEKACRVQFPLKLAYAFTVHKMQGQTIDLAVIDLNSCFEYGQAYTALSRVKTMNGLFLKPFLYSKIKCHPKALDFYKKIANM